MPGLLAGMGEGYQKPAKKHKVPKVLGEKATTGGGHTQVGEMDDEIKQPTPAMKMKEDAHSAKRMATRDWVEGRISTTKHNQIHKRANHVMKNAHKMSKAK